MRGRGRGRPDQVVAVRVDGRRGPFRIVVGVTRVQSDEIVAVVDKGFPRGRIEEARVFVCPDMVVNGATLVG